MSIHELDDQTLEVIRQLAAKHHCSVAELLGAVRERLSRANGDGDKLSGLMADEPELMDQIVESAYEARQSHPLRSPNS